MNRLKLVLVEQKKTGKRLAAQLRKSTCTVSKWCSNTVQPDLHTLDQISKLLNENVKELINDTNIKNSKI
uniref:helix-turn-helix domain-containing protein n=1 Tax=Candidatus Limisoma sp. TaxID=3076476 RepID=UPI003FF12E47